MKHVYRTFENLGITVCQNCAKSKATIEKKSHVIKNGICTKDCPRCTVETCNPPALELIKPVKVKPITIKSKKTRKS